MRTSTDPRPAPPPLVDHHPAANLFALMYVDSAEFGELVAGLLRLRREATP